MPKKKEMSSNFLKKNKKKVCLKWKLLEKSEKVEKENE